jgi:hypothetical protein
MILDWFNAEEAVTFGQEIARDINRLVPLKSASVRKDLKKLDSLLARTRTYAQQHKLNIYKKAKLLNTVKWELRDAGAEEAIINEIIKLLAPLLN